MNVLLSIVSLLFLFAVPSSGERTCSSACRCRQIPLDRGARRALRSYLLLCAIRGWRAFSR